MKRFPWVCGAMVLCSMAWAGCTSSPFKRAPAPAREPYLLRPVVAVTDFDQRVEFTGPWDVGGGLAEILIERLMQSGEVTVLERHETDTVFREWQRQARELFRAGNGGSAQRGTQARFLIRGVVTEFVASNNESGWFDSTVGAGRFHGARSRVGLYLTVTDLETGQMVTAVRSQGAVSAGRLGGDIDYTGIPFAGDAYFRTPLGRATQQATEQAVKQILAELPRERWQPRVAEGGTEIVINGGENVGLKVGQRFTVRAQGRTITDPVTGERIEQVPGRAIGLLEVRRVLPRAAYAQLVDGQAERGDHLEPVY